MNTTTSAYTSTVRTAPPEPGEPVRIGVLVPISRFLWEGADPRDLIDFGRRAEALGLNRERRRGIQVPCLRLSLQL